MLVAFSELQFSTEQSTRNSPWSAVLSTFGTKNLAVEFFAANAPNPPRFDPTLMFVAFSKFRFSTVQRRETRPGAFRATFGTKKLAVQIFCNERTQSTPFDQRLMFLAFLGVSVSTEQRRKLALEGVLATFGTKNLQLNFSATNAPNPPRLTQNSCLLRFWSFGFRRNIAELAREETFSPLLEQKILQLNFRNERTQSTLFDPKLMFVAFLEFPFDGTNGAKLAREDRSSQFWNEKSAVKFSATNAPNPPRLNQHSCLLRFRSFGFRRTNGAKLALEGRSSHFWNKNLQSNFLTNAPNPPRLT
jgi:hypothetical protein